MNKYYPPVHQVSSAPPAYIDGFPQQLNQTPTIIHQQPAPVPASITLNQISGGGPLVLGQCPSCRVGELKNNYTFCGICCALVLFPIGILCCCHWRQKKCSNCGWRSA
ncbi:brain protein I3-like isoform X2 [Ctenocephalides felis]|nr:brain protein I3-like isoform X2 [Ctenocephalides felis]